MHYPSTWTNPRKDSHAGAGRKLHLLDYPCSGNVISGTRENCSTQHVSSCQLFFFSRELSFNFSRVAESRFVTSTQHYSGKWPNQARTPLIHSSSWAMSRSNEPLNSPHTLFHKRNWKASNRFSSQKFSSQTITSNLATHA